MFNSGTCVTPVSGPADLGGWTANLQKSHGTGAAAEYDDRLGHRHTRLPERATRPRTGHHDCDVEKDQQSQVRHKSSKKVLEANDSEGLACCGWLQLYIYTTVVHKCLTTLWLFPVVPKGLRHRESPGVENVWVFLAGTAEGGWIFSFQMLSFMTLNAMTSP